MSGCLVSLEEMEELRERNRQLEAALVGLADTALAMDLGLTPIEFTIFRVLKTHRVVSREALMTALYSGRPQDPPDPKVIDVFICKLRKKLAAHGFDIASQWGTGWRLERGPEGGAR
ncbi:helix-turn-helix domain-containing protein [Martelella sp. FLE1502]